MHQSFLSATKWRLITNGLKIESNETKNILKLCKQKAKPTHNSLEMSELNEIAIAFEFFSFYFNTILTAVTLKYISCMLIKLQKRTLIQRLKSSDIK